MRRSRPKSGDLLAKEGASSAPPTYRGALEDSLEDLERRRIAEAFAERLSARLNRLRSPGGNP